MAPESKSKPDSVSVEGKNHPGSTRKPFQVDKIRWEWPNPKGEGLQKLIAHEHITGMRNAVENAVQNGHRAWEGLVQHGIRATNLFNIDLPNARVGKRRPALQAKKQIKDQEEPARAAVFSSRPRVQGATTATAHHGEENGSQEREQVETHFRFPEGFRLPEVSSDGAVTKEDLGRATWTLLHTLAAQYPDHPTRQQQRDVKDLMSIMARLYPCKTCAEHFKEVLKAYPVKADSGVELAQWMCRVHNVVNRSLGKPQFPCQRVDARWGSFTAMKAHVISKDVYFTDKLLESKHRL